MSRFGLSMFKNNLQPLASQQMQRTPYQLQQLAEELNQQFNTGQRQVFNETNGSVLQSESINNLNNPTFETPIYSQPLFLLDASGGIGKSFVTTAIPRYLKTKRKNVLAVASSATTTQLLGSSRTAHSALNILISISFKRTCNINAYSRLAHDLHETHLIIYDKIVTTHSCDLKALNRTLYDN